MNELELFENGTAVKMDSREIAELTEKRHSHVCRDIRTQLESQRINQSIFGSVYLDAKGEIRNCFQLNYEQTMILISGYSIPLRAKIIKRWTELEQQNKPALPNSFAEALKLAYEQQLVIEQKEQQLLEQAPKVDFYDTVSQTNGWYNAKQLSNMLAIPELGRNNLLKRLRDMKYLTEYNKPYQKWIDQKLMKLAEDKKGYTFAIFSQKFIDRIIKEIK